VLASQRVVLKGFVDDRWPDLPAIWDIPVVGRLSDLVALRSLADAVIIAIGDNTRRRLAFESALAAGFEIANVIHPRAHLSSRVRMGRGVAVMAGAIIGTEASVDDGAIVNAAAVVDHHGRVGAFAHLGVGACMGGGAVLGEGAWLQEGRTLAPGQIVEADGIVARLAS
jgi:acetyltransferase-like isoleucine patch superfamily enzyme